jgi:hypothetical protein
LKQGVVVFVSPGSTPFNQTKYGPFISEKITRGEHEKWIFYYVEQNIFGDFPKSRDYYDVNDKKIEWNDY